MKKFFLDNPTIAFGLGLPLLLVAVFLLASGIPVVSGADVAICQMETPYGPPGGPFTDYPAFAVPPQIAAAIIDLFMPGTDGPSCARRLRQRNPHLPILFMTGHTEQAAGMLGAQEAEAPLLEKPFSMRQLSKVLAAVIASTAAPPRP